MSKKPMKPTLAKEPRKDAVLDFHPHPELVCRGFEQVTRGVGRAATRVYGSTTLQNLSGFLSQPQGIKDLIKPQNRYYLYQAMGTYPTIASMLNAFGFLMGSVTWTSNPATDANTEIPNAEQEGDAQFMTEIMKDMNRPFSEEVVDMVLMAMKYGACMKEIIYKVRRGNRPESPSDTSLYSDGCVGWASFDERTMDRILKWNMNDKGDLISIEQSWYGRDYTVPISRLAHFYFRTEKKDPTGQSILLPGYEGWLAAKVLENHRNKGIGRDMGPLTILKYDAKFLDVVGTETNADGTETKTYRYPDKAQMLIETMNALAKIDTEDVKVIALPSMFGPNGKPTMEIDTLASNPKMQVAEITNAINDYDEKIIRTVLAGFVLLGSNASGSRALSEDQSNIFIRLVENFLKTVRDYFNDILIPRLMRFNGMERAAYPWIDFSDLTKAGPEVMIPLIKQCIESGVLANSPELRRFIADKLGVPISSATTSDELAIDLDSEVPNVGGAEAQLDTATSDEVDEKRKEKKEKKEKVGPKGEVVRQKGDEWCVYLLDGTEQACFDNPEDAYALLAIIDAE